MTRTFITECPSPKDIREVTFTEKHIARIASVITGVMADFHKDIPAKDKAIFKAFADLFPEVSALVDSQIDALKAVKAEVLK